MARRSKSFEVYISEFRVKGYYRRKFSYTVHLYQRFYCYWYSNTTYDIGAAYDVQFRRNREYTEVHKKRGSQYLTLNLSNLNRILYVLYHFNRG